MPELNDRPLRRLAFRVEYDGTEYCGWQAQAGQRTIQGALTQAVLALDARASEVAGSSRTDAGVHARDQLAAVSISLPMTPTGFVKAVNTRLPPDIAVRDAQEVGLDFAPRFATRSKRYLYRFYRHTARRPLVDRFALRVQHDLDFEAMRVAAQHLIGTHDFTAFAASDSAHKTAVRTIFEVTVGLEGHEVYALSVTGQAFLKLMVRTIAGTLLDVGRGQRAPDSVRRALESRSRRQAGPTAAARGLTLDRVDLRELSETQRDAQVEVEVEAG